MKESIEELVKSLHELRDFLESAPKRFGPNDKIRRHELPNAEIVSCIKWEEGFFISGTDILRCIVYRFQAFGREVLNRAKFEEFVFSDLRSLKTNVRARLEEGKSELLEFLHNYGCIRTKKKQRVFYWDAVPHDQLFLDSLERELRRAVIDDANNEGHRITVAIQEPALSMRYDPLLKVAHQIDNILSETPSQYIEIMCVLLGARPPANGGPIPAVGALNKSTTHSQEVSRTPSHADLSTSVIHTATEALSKQLTVYRQQPLGTAALTYALMAPTIDDRLPPPQMNIPSSETRNIQLPSIQDALPAHAQIDLFPPQNRSQQN